MTNKRLFYADFVWYRKIPKIFFNGPFWGAYIQRGLSTEGSLRFKIDWASLIFGSKFSVFSLFNFVFEGNFPSARPRGAYIWRGDLTEMFLRYRFGGLIFGGGYFWNFTVYEELCTILKGVILLDLHNSSDHTQSHSVIAKYLFSFHLSYSTTC